MNNKKGCGLVESKNKDFPVVGELLKCYVCKREILVERVLLGIDHNFVTTATCWNCLDSKTKNKAIKKHKLNNKRDVRDVLGN